MTTTLTVPAFPFAFGWLATALAASDDSLSDVLHRTVHVRVAPGGIRLESTDSYMAVSTWIALDAHAWHRRDRRDFPRIGDDDYSAEFVIRDPLKRAAAIMRHAVADLQGSGEMPANYERTLTLTRRESDTLALFASHEWELDYGGLEAITLPEVDGEFPDLGVVFDGHRPEPADQFGIGGPNLEKLAKLQKHTGYAIGVTPSGERGFAAIAVDTWVNGVAIDAGLMPAIVGEWDHDGADT